MWFRLGIQDFLLKKRRKRDGCEIFISNLRSIWFKRLKNEELLNICKELNPLFEASDAKLIEKTLDLFSDDEGIIKELNQSEDEITLNLKSNITGIRFAFELVLQKGDNELLYKELILPLFLMSKKMQNTGQRLMQIIKDKDVEIAEYKLENVSLKRTHLITKPFIEKEFEDGDHEFNPTLLEVSKNPTKFFDKVSQSKLSKIDEIISTEEAETATSSNNIKVESGSLNNGNQETKSENFTKVQNVKQESEKVYVKVDTFDVKKRKIQNTSSKLKF